MAYIREHLDNYSSMIRSELGGRSTTSDYFTRKTRADRQVKNWEILKKHQNFPPIFFSCRTGQKLQRSQLLAVCTTSMFMCWHWFLEGDPLGNGSILIPALALANPAWLPEIFICIIRAAFTSNFALQSDVLQGFRIEKFKAWLILLQSNEDKVNK